MDAHLNVSHKHFVPAGGLYVCVWVYGIRDYGKFVAPLLPKANVVPLGVMWVVVSLLLQGSELLLLPR
jgi:hypothetical protein